VSKQRDLKNENTTHQQNHNSLPSYSSLLVQVPCLKEDQQQGGQRGRELEEIEVADESVRLEDQQSNRLPRPRTFRGQLEYIYWVFYVNICLRPSRRRREHQCAATTAMFQQVTNRRLAATASSSATAAVVASTSDNRSATVRYVPCSRNDPPQTDEEELDQIVSVTDEGHTTMDTVKDVNVEDRVLRDNVRCNSVESESFVGCDRQRINDKLPLRRATKREQVTSSSLPNGPPTISSRRKNQPQEKQMCMNKTVPTTMAPPVQKRFFAFPFSVGVYDVGANASSSDATTDAKSRRLSTRESTIDETSLFEHGSSSLGRTNDNQAVKQPGVMLGRLPSRAEDVSYYNKGHTIEPSLTPRHVRMQRRKEIARTFGRKRGDDSVSGGSSEKDGCRWTLVFDPSGR